MQSKVEICGVNTAKLKVLPGAQTMSLLELCKQGDLQAREELISGNLRLVLSVIQRFAGRGEMADDLFQVGCVGLIKAIDNFDTSENVRFSTYAVPMKVCWGNILKLSTLLYACAILCTVVILAVRFVVAMDARGFLYFRRW